MPDKLMPLSGRQVELAWNENRQRYRVSEDAHAWRVYQSRPHQKAAPLFTADGAVELDVHASFRDLATAVDGVAGNYQLVAIDEYGDVVPDLPVSHVEVTPPETDAAAEERSLFGELASTVRFAVSHLVAQNKALTDALAVVTVQHAESTARLQEATAGLVTASRDGYDVATGVRQTRPELPPPPPAAKDETFMTFLCSPAGAQAVKTLQTVVAAATNKK